MDENVVCPHCGHNGMILQCVDEIDYTDMDYECPACGYVGLSPEDPMSYVIPSSIRM